MCQSLVCHCVCCLSYQPVLSLSTITMITITSHTINITFPVAMLWFQCYGCWLLSLILIDRYLFHFYLFMYDQFMCIIYQWSVISIDRFCICGAFSASAQFGVSWRALEHYYMITGITGDNYDCAPRHLSHIWQRCMPERSCFQSANWPPWWLKWIWLRHRTCDEGLTAHWGSLARALRSPCPGSSPVHWRTPGKSQFSRHLSAWCPAVRPIAMATADKPLEAVAKAQSPPTFGRRKLERPQTLTVMHHERRNRSHFPVNLSMSSVERGWGRIGCSWRDILDRIWKLWFMIIFILYRR